MLSSLIEVLGKRSKKGKIRPYTSACAYARARQSQLLDEMWLNGKAALYDLELREEVLLNILLYIPFGSLIHYAFPKLKWWTIVVSGFLMSGLTETIQLFFKLGLCEVDDLISNTLGTIIGVGLYCGYKRIVARK